MKPNRNCKSNTRSHAALAASLAALLPSLALAQTFVRVQTDLGALDLAMYDRQPGDPLNTVANFMDYVSSGAYDGMLFHRSAKNADGTPFVLQTGGFYDDPARGPFLGGGAQAIPLIQANLPLLNEPGISNVRATLAMAKVGGNPDSASDEWFINLADNSANLDSQNGGFTVFGEVQNGMDVVDEIFSLGLLANCTSVSAVLPCGLFGNMPVIDDNRLINLDTMINVIAIGVDTDGDGAVDRLESTGAGQASIASAPQADDPSSTIEVSTPGAGNPLHSFQVLGRTFILSRPPIRDCVLNGVDLANGLVAFDVSVSSGAGIDVDVTLPAGQSPDSYWMYGPDSLNTLNHWYQFTGAAFNANVVTLTLVDGGQGDADLTVNGVIQVAPGGAGTSVAPAVLTDGDCDGPDDSVESDPLNNSGDGNGDSIQDDIESYVASMPDVNGDYISLETDPAMNLGNVHESDRMRLFSRASSAPLASFNFPSGFIEFSVSNVVPGGAADVRLILPVGTPADHLYTLGPDTGNLTEHWYDFSFDGATGTGMEINGNIMTLHLVDGGRGDRDHSSNGTIYMAVAPAVAIANSGGSSGGCTLSSGAGNSRKAGAWLLMLMLGSGWWLVRRLFSVQ